VIALLAGNDPGAPRLAGFQMKLAAQFERGFGGFRTAGSKINAPGGGKTGGAISSSFTASCSAGALENCEE
jgi:hypothetical protein